jgi:serine protease Do
MLLALVTRSLRVFAATVGLVSLVNAASIDPALQKSVRAATVEVVLPRPLKDPLTYERSLPLELLPFSERNDRFHSLGTAFSIAPGVYVSAAHVMTAGIGSEFGAPALRVDGTVYPIDKVLKFSQHEDFMVFTVSGDVPGGILATSAAPAIDEAVYSVGNAQGEGVVIRDGLLTSMTPEDQDGRWNWLRFSAATSPGNSGGPLLDSAGRVVGVVVARSAGENLNYALPIERVLQAPEGIAAYDTREAFALPHLIDTGTGTLKATFKLPMPFAQFAARHQALHQQYWLKQRDALLSAKGQDLFPNGTTGKSLYGAPRGSVPALVVESDEREWRLLEGGKPEATNLPGDGVISVRMARGIGLFLLTRPNEAHDDAFYGDSNAFMDLLLRGVKLTRAIANQSIRIRSAGPAVSEELYTDTWGRRWQMRRWPLGYTQVSVVVAALPTPTGYVGMVRMSPAASASETAEELKTLTTNFTAPMEGSLPQWQAYLARKALRPARFDAITLAGNASDGFHFVSARLNASVPEDLLRVTETGWLRLETGFVQDGAKTTWDVAGLTLAADHGGETYLTLSRRVRPAADGDRDAMERWDKMLNRKDEFDGVTAHDPDYKASSVRMALARTENARGAPLPASGVLYETMYRTTEKLEPGAMDARRATMLQTLKVLEP